jgi:hypothetical protein
LDLQAVLIQGEWLGPGSGVRGQPERTRPG